MARALRDIAMERNRARPRCVVAGNCAALDPDALGLCNRERSCGLLRPQIGAQLVNGYPSHVLNIMCAEGGYLSPLRHGLRRDWFSDLG